MFQKLAAVIVVAGLVGCTLLAQRQLRMQAAHDLVETQRRLVEHDRELALLRLQVGKLTDPAAVRDISRDFGPLEPIRAGGDAEEDRAVAALAMNEEEDTGGTPVPPDDDE